VLSVISGAVRAVLIADGGVSALVSTRVYYQLAPQDADLPYILMDEAGGGSTNDTPRKMLDVMWQVKAISKSMSEAATLEALIYDALDDAVLNPASPWKAIDCRHEMPFSYPEHVEAKQYFHAGGTFRVRMAH
jgi:hypothetical protein